MHVNKASSANIHSHSNPQAHTNTSTVEKVMERINIFSFHLVAMEIRALNWILIFVPLPFYFRSLFHLFLLSSSHPLIRFFLFLLVRVFVLPTRTCWSTASQTSITLGNKLRSKRSQGEFVESSQTVCERFSNPLPNNTFFSPIDTTMLSDTYPPKVDCILKITG